MTARLVPAIVLSFCLSAAGWAQNYDVARQAYLDADYARAAEELRPLVAQNDADALNLWALMHELGQGVPQNTLRAFELYRQSADLGNNRALNNLGLFYQNGAPGLPPDMQRAAAAFEEAIEAGNAGALNNLGALIENGHLGAPDWPRVVDLYQRGWQAGDLDAQMNLASLYFSGRGIAQDLPRAIELANDAAAQDFPRAFRFLGYAHELGQGLPLNTDLAVDYYIRAANAGLSPAANDLGVLFELGGEGLPPNLQRAVLWYEQAIDMGNVYAPRNLGNLLQEGGPGLTPEPERRLALLELGVERGDSGAMVDLSHLYWDGMGVPQDFGEARRLLQMAVDLNDPSALNDLGVLYHDGLGGPVDIDTSVVLYRRAAELRNSYGAMNLSSELMDVNSRYYDPVQGYAWCQFGRAHDAENAQIQQLFDECLMRVEEQLGPEDKQSAREAFQALMAQY